MTQVQIAKSPSGGTHPPEPIRASLTRYVWITLAIVAVTQLPIVAWQRSFVASMVRPQRHVLSELPLAFEHWTGKVTELDPRIFVVIGAEEQINRLYMNPDGAAIAVHCATWTSPNPGTPHGPDDCYSRAGWKLLQSRTMTLPGRPDAPIAEREYERSGERVVVIFWYQMDDRTYVDRVGERTVRRAHWGQREWPPLTKVLLQTDLTDFAEPRLLEIAPRIYEFVRKL
jgi:hypothetical protein